MVPLPLTIDDQPTRVAFDDAYNKYIVGSAFLEIPKYYHDGKERYWITLNHICRLHLHRRGKILEFGGGQMSILLNAIYGCDCTVADISEDFKPSLSALGIPLLVADLSRDPPILGKAAKADVIIMLEVIEHIPQPPSRVFKRLAQLMNPEARLFLTTPNLFRLRNVIRMILGREIFDRFMDPVPGVGLGHQMEYSRDHLQWQLESAGFSIEYFVHDQLGQIGHSRSARLVRRILAPLLLRPKWREELVACAKLV